jgi:hypothetical protein
VTLRACVAHPCFCLIQLVEKMAASFQLSQQLNATSPLSHRALFRRLAGVQYSDLRNSAYCSCMVVQSFGHPHSRPHIMVIAGGQSTGTFRLNASAFPPASSDPKVPLTCTQSSWKSPSSQDPKSIHLLVELSHWATRPQVTTCICYALFVKFSLHA